jgi:hypothetical protein
MHHVFSGRACHDHWVARGMGSHESIDDDEGGTIAGHALPVLLRPVEDGAAPGGRVPTYRIVGQTYFLGLLEGEAANDGAPKSHMFDDICLA